MRDKIIITFLTQVERYILDRFEISFLNEICENEILNGDTLFDKFIMNFSNVKFLEKTRLFNIFEIKVQISRTTYILLSVNFKEEYIYIFNVEGI